MCDPRNFTAEASATGLSRDVWSSGGGWQLPDLIASALSTLLLLGNSGRPAYFSSPWMSDFALFDNRCGAYRSLFPMFADQERIMFSDFLARLAASGVEVRIITTRTETSARFLGSPRLKEPIAAEAGLGRIAARYAEESYHEKGILAPSFYIEGSMNITHMGVFIRGEKVSYHTVGEPGHHPKIAAAYLEFERRWGQLR
ncbi:phospholipase D-like domain-containing protein DpdK [Methylobacterium sp. CM6244]